MVRHLMGKGIKEAEDGRKEGCLSAYDDIIPSRRRVIKWQKVPIAIQDYLQTS